jgi:predicted transcriptional regulator
MSKVDKFVSEIKDILRKDTRGLTIQEISERLKTSRITANLALMKLDGMGLLDVRIIGNCRLHYLKEISKGV